ncbi:serine/threonine-protein kinase [Staphylococcus chromogenes]|nr:serine/threonine-protein kinase [Staphylococcus chromogenes]
MTSYNTEGIERIQPLIGEDYRLQWIIGHGGMSTVWLADDLRHNREVAIKVLRPEFADNNEFLTRFRNEAESAENINHDNVVRTYDYRESRDASGTTFCFIVMEFIRGESLADLIAREGRLTEERALGLLEQAAYGLATIHALGLVHRDIKPGNIMVTPEDRVKITDFGIAKAAAAVPLTRTGMVVGTAQYVSPEQAQGHNVTAASDIYSLGVVGYELLSGRRPFNGESSVSVAISHIKDAAPPLDVSVSAPARELIAIAMRKSASRRFPEGGAFAQSISRVRLGQPPIDPSPATEEPTGVFASPTTATTVMPVGTPAEALAAAGGAPKPVAAPRPQPAFVPAQQPAPRKKGGAGWAILALLGLLAGGGAAYAFLNSGDDPAPAPAPAPVTSQVVTSTRAPQTTSSKAPTTTSTTPSKTPEATTIYVTPTQEPTTAESTTSKSKEKKTKDKDPQVSVPEAPLPSQTVELPSIEMPSLPGVNPNSNKKPN